MAAPLKTQSPVSSIDAQAEAPESIAPLESAAQLDPLHKLDGLVAAALMGPAPSQEKLSAEINAMMKLARETVGGRRVADALLALLHSKKLAGFVAPDGKSCRSMAVEQLLALGFPFALEVMPEDLAFHREHERSLSPFAKVSLGLLAGFTASCPVVASLPSAHGARLGHPLGMALGIVTALIALLLLTPKPSSRRAKWLRRSLWAAGVLGLVLGGYLFSPFTMWPGALAAVTAGALLWPKSTADDDA